MIVCVGPARITAWWRLMNLASICRSLSGVRPTLVLRPSTYTTSRPSSVRISSRVAPSGAGLTVRSRSSSRRMLLAGGDRHRCRRCGARGFLERGTQLLGRLLQFLDARVAGARLGLQAVDGLLGGDQVLLQLAQARGGAFACACALSSSAACSNSRRSSSFTRSCAALQRRALLVRGLDRIRPVLHLAAHGGQLRIQFGGALALGAQGSFKFAIAGAALGERRLVFDGGRRGGGGLGARRLDRGGEVDALGQQPAQLALALRLRGGLLRGDGRERAHALGTGLQLRLQARDAGVQAL